jgi:lactoylglutathione lyase
MSVRGLFETHLAVADLPRSVEFYRDVVGLPVALEMPERGAAFHWVGRPGQAMLGLWSTGSAPMGMQLHIAFAMAVEDVLDAPQRLSAQGIQPLSFFGDPATEPSYIGWMPAAAVYFRDPSGHMLEYLAMLEEAPRPELGVLPWAQRDRP